MRMSKLWYLALFIAPLGGCAETVAPLSESLRPSMSLGSTAVSFTVQAATTGPNGEILQDPVSYDVCGYGTKQTWAPEPIEWVMQCDTRVQEGYTNYDGGTVDVWLLGPNGEIDHLAHTAANWEMVDISGVPSGATVRMTAYPNSDAEFNYWSEAGTVYYTPTIERAVYGGELFFAQLYMK